MPRTLVPMFLLLLPLAGEAQVRDNQETIDASIIRGTVGYARALSPRVLAGIEIGFGFPQIDRTLSPGERDDGYPSFEEYGHIALFARYAPAPAFEVDLGIRGSFADLWRCDASDCWPVGFAGLYVQPMVGWERFKVGPRLTAGVAADGETDRDGSTRVVSLSPLNLRLTIPW